MRHLIDYRSQRLCAVWLNAAALGAIFWLPLAAQSGPGVWEPVTANVFLFRDACNVYALRHGDSAVLVDLGSGAALSRLNEIAVKNVAGIYLTHRDRDQWFGFREAETRGIPIYAPAIDPDRFGYTSASIRRYWNEFFPVRDSRFIYSVATAETDYPRAEVTDGATIESGGVTLRAMATPGHTNDHMAYVAQIDGRKIAFTGDLIYGRGKVWQGFQLDWDHWRGTGHEAAFRSLLRVRDERPAIVAPSHGEVMRESVEETLLATADRVWRAAKLKNFELYAAQQDPPILATRPLRRLQTLDLPHPGGGGRMVPLERLSERLWVAANTYFLLADDGSCFAVDNDFPPEWWDTALSRIGAKTVEKLWVTHLHSDHTRHLPALREKLGFELVTVREMADLLEKPSAFLHPYANFDGVRADRVLEDGEEFEWKGYRFRAHFAPGQTWFHSFLETTVDGRRVVFSGDSFYPVKEWDLANGTGGWSGLNRGFPGYHSRSARRMIEIRPDWVLAEHRMPFLYDPLEWEYRVRWGEEAAAVLDALSPSGNHRFDFNPHVFGVYPLISRGPRGVVELRVDNPFNEPMRVDFRIPESAPVSVEPRQGSLTAPGRSGAAGWLRYAVAGAPPDGTRLAVPVEITARGQYLGQACYFLVE